MLTESLSIKNADFPPQILHGIQRWPSEASRNWVERFIALNASNKQVIAVIAFGSCIRDVSYSADVDLLIIYSDQKPEISPPIEVDVRAYKKNDVGSLINKGNEVLGWSIRYGIVLHEKNRYWTALCNRWRDRLPLPSADEALKRAERSKNLLEDLEKIGDEEAIEEQQLTMFTQLARVHLINSGIFPISRPELPMQLKSVGEEKISNKLSKLIAKRYI